MLIPKLFHSLPAISVLLLTLILTPRPAWAECWLITDRTGVNRKALCGHNRPPFEYLPMNLNASIVLLNVTGNHLQRLDPKALGRYPVLRRLDLTYNLLSSLPEAAFSALPDLRVLLLGHNQLAHLPGDTFRGLGHLEILGLEANILESVSVTAFLGLSALQDLNLSVNRLAWLPERLLHIFPQLHILRLGGNPLACKCALLPFLLLLHTLPVSLDSETSCYSPPDLAGLPPQRPNPDPTAKMFKSFSRPPAASALERLSLTCPTPVTSPNPVTSPSPPEATTSSTPGFMPVVPMIGRSPDVLEEENNCLPGRCLNTDEKFIDRVMPTAPHPSLELKSVSLKGATLLARIPRPLERFFVLSRYNSGNCIKLRKLSRTFESIPVSDISSEGFTTFCIASVKRSHCLNHTCLKFNSSGAVWPHRSGLGLQISPGEASEEARGQAFFGWGWGNGLAMVAGVVMLVVMLSCVIWRSRRKGDGHDGGTSGIGVMGDRSGTDMTNISATEEEDGVVSKEEEMPTRPQMKSLTPPQRPPPYPLSPSSTKFTSHTPVTSPMPAAATGGYVEVSGHANMASGIESLKSVPHQVEAGITVSSLFSAVPSRTIITSEGSLSPSAQSESGTSQVIMASPPHVMLGRNKGSFGIPATLATMKEPGLDTKDAASLFVDTTPTNRTPFCGAPQIAAISQEVDRVNVIISSCIDALRGSNSSSSGGSGLAGTGSETTVAVPHTSSAPHGFMLLRAEELAALARGPMSQTCSAHPSTSRSVAVPSNTSKIQHNLHLTRGFTSVPESAVSLLPAHSSSSSCLPPCRPPRTPPLLWRDDSQTSLSHPPITHPIEVHPPTAHYHLAQSPSSALPVQALQPSFSPSSPETPSARRAARALWRKLQRVRGRARRDDTHMQTPGSLYMLMRLSLVVSKGAGHALKEKVQRARGEDLHEILDYWKGVSAQHT